MEDPRAKLEIWLRHVSAGAAYALLLYSDHPEWNRPMFELLKQLSTTAEELHLKAKMMARSTEAA